MVSSVLALALSYVLYVDLAFLDILNKKKKNKTSQRNLSHVVKEATCLGGFSFLWWIFQGGGGGGVKDILK